MVAKRHNEQLQVRVVPCVLFELLGGALIYFLLFGPFWERLFQLTNIFGKASNHQLAYMGLAQKDSAPRIV